MFSSILFYCQYDLIILCQKQNLSAMEVYDCIITLYGEEKNRIRRKMKIMMTNKNIAEGLLRNIFNMYNLRSIRVLLIKFKLQRSTK